MMANATGANAMRARVTALAGVRIAPRPVRLATDPTSYRLGLEVGACGADDRTSWNVPTVRSSGTSTMPSISGASRWLRATPALVDEHLDRSYRPRSSRRAAVISSCSSRSSARRSSTAPRVDLAVEAGGVRALLGEYEKKPHQSSCAASTKRRSASWSASVSPG